MCGRNFTGNGHFQQIYGRREHFQSEIVDFHPNPELLLSSPQSPDFPENALDWECDILKTSGYVPVLRPFLWPNFAVQKMGVLQKLPISSPASINRPHDLKMTTSIWIKVNKGSGIVKRITS